MIATSDLYLRCRRSHFRSSNLESLFGILFALHKNTPEHGKWVLACLEGAWPKLLGDTLAGVCRPAEFKDSVLFIEVVDKDWEDTLSSMKSELQGKLRTATAGEIKKVHISRQKVVDSRQ